MKKINVIVFNNNFYKFFTTSGIELAVLTVELSSGQATAFALPTVKHTPTEISINAELRQFFIERTFKQPPAMPAGPALATPLVF